MDIVKLGKHVLDDAACPKGRTLPLGIIQLTRQQQDLVCVSGYDYIQGFLYSAPLPIEQAEIYYRAYSAGLAWH